MATKKITPTKKVTHPTKKVGYSTKKLSNKEIMTKAFSDTKLWGADKVSEYLDSNGMKIITKRDKKSTGTKEVKLHTGTKKVPVSKYAIEVNDITVSAKKSIFTKRVNLISNVSFNVPIGNVTVFIGHNGAGKTTTTKAILDFVKLDTGSIKIFGVDHKNHNSRKDIGYIPEKNDIKNITVNEFFHQIGAFYDLNTKQTNERVLDLIKFFDFSKSNLKKRINKLSSGEKKIINFIQAFFVQHSLILMDEPTDNLDPQTRDLFWEFIEHYRKQHPQTSFLIVTHNLDEIQKYADYLIFMNKGIIKQTMKYDGHEGLRHLYKNLRDKWNSKVDKDSSQVSSKKVV